jgi:hypothetical protein
MSYASEIPSEERGRSMKWLVFLIGLTLPMAPWGQEQKKAEAVVAKPTAKKSKKPAIAKKSQSRRHEDARHCLERATNNDIIKCAEAYL